MHASFASLVVLAAFVHVALGAPTALRADKDASTSLHFQRDQRDVMMADVPLAGHVHFQRDIYDAPLIGERDDPASEIFPPALPWPWISGGMTKNPITHPIVVGTFRSADAEESKSDAVVSRADAFVHDHNWSMGSPRIAGTFPRADPADAFIHERNWLSESGPPYIAGTFTRADPADTFVHEHNWLSEGPPLIAGTFPRADSGDGTVHARDQPWTWANALSEAVTGRPLNHDARDDGARPGPAGHVVMDLSD